MENPDYLFVILIWNASEINSEEFKEAFGAYFFPLDTRLRTTCVVKLRPGTVDIFDAVSQTLTPVYDAETARLCLAKSISFIYSLDPEERKNYFFYASSINSTVLSFSSHKYLGCNFAFTGVFSSIGNERVILVTNATEGDDLVCLWTEIVKYKAPMSKARRAYNLKNLIASQNSNKDDDDFDF